MFQNKNIKLYFIALLLFTFATDSMACVLSFQTETRSKFSKWMSQQVLVQAVENHLENNTNRVYQLQYRESPLNIRHTSNWISYEGLQQFVINTATNTSTQYRIRYKPKPSKTKATPETKDIIDDLRLTNRTANVLKAGNIYSIRDLLARTEQDLLEIRNMRKKYVAEIKDTLAQHGLALRSPKPDTAKNTNPSEVLNQEIDVLELSVRSTNVLKGEGIYFIKDLLARSEIELLAMVNLGKLSVEIIKALLAEKGLTLRSREVPPEEILDQKVVDYLNLTVRTSNVLQAESIFTVRDLISKSEIELLEMPNMGQTSVKIIKALLAEKGLALRSKEVPPEEILDQKVVDYLNLESLQEALRTESILTMRDLLARSELDLLEIPNMGQTSVEIIKTLLAEKDLALRSREVPPEEILDQKVVDYLNLTVRTSNVLQAESIFTVRDLTAKSEGELLAMVNLGKLSVTEVKAELAQKGLTLRIPNKVLDQRVTDYLNLESLQEALQVESILTMQDLLARSEIELLAMVNLGKASVEIIKALLAEKDLALRSKEVPLEILDSRVDGDYLNLTVRTSNILQAESIFTVRDLTAKSEIELLAKVNLGKVSVTEIKDALAERGLALRSPKPETAQDIATTQAQEISPEVLNQEIDVLELSVRSTNVLKGEGIYFIKDLLARSEIDLLEIPSMGNKTVAEIKDALAQHGLALRNSNEALVEDLQLTTNRAINALRAGDIYSIRDLVQRSEQDLLSIPNLGRKSIQEIKDALAVRGLALRSKEVPQEEVLDQKVVDYLDLGTRLNRLLTFEGIITMRDLLEKSERDLFYMRGIGRKSIQEIKDALAARGLALRSPKPETATDAILHTQVENYLSLSLSVINALKTKRIYSMQDLFLSESDLILEVGEAAAKKIKDALAEKNLALPLETSPETAQRIARNKQKSEFRVQLETVAQEQGIPLEVLDQKVVNYLPNLGTRLNGFLTAENIITMGDLLVRTERDILRIYNLGKTSVEKLKNALAKKGLTLGLQLPPPPQEKREWWGI